MKTRKYLTIGFVVLLVLSFSLVASSKEHVRLDGIGDSVSKSFYLEKGVAIFDLSHSGNANFIVKLFNKTTGNLVDLLVNEIGYFEGETLFGVKTEGDYVLNVTADGNWNIDISQPSPSTGSTPPLSLTGESYGVTDAINLTSGLKTFSFSHDGKANFIVILYRKDGSIRGLLVNKIGQYEGEKAVSIYSQGLYYIDVVADGSWKIEVES